MTEICRSQMKKYGITSVDALHSVEERASNGELKELRKDLVENLIIASEWLQNNTTVDILGQFDERKFHEISKKHEETAKHYTYANDYINTCLGSPYNEDNLKYYNHVNSTPGLLDKVIEEGSAATMRSPNLREKIGSFAYESFLDKALRLFHDAVGQKDHKGKTFVVAGRTQSGKSAFKGVVQSLGGVLGLPGIILTKGVDESIDLNEKLTDLANGTLVRKEHVVAGECQCDGSVSMCFGETTSHYTHFSFFVASNRKDRMTPREKNAKIERAFAGKGETHGGMLVIADTKAQVQKAKRALELYREKNPGGKYILVVDEADAMFRTEDRRQVFEQELEELRATNPTMVRNDSFV